MTTCWMSPRLAAPADAAVASSIRLACASDSSPTGTSPWIFPRKATVTRGWSHSRGNPVRDRHADTLIPPGDVQQTERPDVLPVPVVTGTPNGFCGVQSIGHPHGEFTSASEGLTR